MKRTDQRKDTPKRNSNEGTAARTRPFSFEEIMSRRKHKLSAGNKEAVNSLMEQSTRGDAKGDLDHIETPPEGMKGVRDKGGSSSKKTREMVYKREGGYSELNDKHKVDSEVHAKLRSSHSKSSRDAEIKNEKQIRQKSKDYDRTVAVLEKENEKKEPKHTGKDKTEERGRKHRGEIKIKDRDYPDARNRLENDGFNSKRHDSRKNKYNEHTEINERKKDDFRSYRDGPRTKRRRSWSREHDHERDRSISSSPRVHKQAYHVHGPKGSSPQYSREKSGRKYSDGDAHKTSGNGGYGTGHYRKQRSGLGGYSPRKRRSEAAIRTPSPIARSPDRKKTTWDQPPDANISDVQHMKNNMHSSFSKTNELTSSFPATTAAKVLSSATPVEISTMMSTSIESIQLTQATRPMRRLYIENLPASASEKATIDCLNEFLLSSGVNHIKGTSPCISCLINKEKNQAVVEFLTPEDATAALSFDGSSLSGSIVKIRRPKDFFEAPTETKEKPKEEVKTISSTVKNSAHKEITTVVKEITTVVKDSPHKIFVGGFSESLSSSMIMEIANALGTLKAYHFEFNEELNAPCVFLEYVDHSITLKACAGLNGMRLGGKIITAVQAFPDTLVDDENVETPSTYHIPTHAKPLLAASTKVLKLKNVLNREEFFQLSESEVEDILDDIKIECARFGTVKSLNIIRYTKNPETVSILESKINDSNANCTADIRSTDNDKGITTKSMIDGGSACEQPPCITELSGGQRLESATSINAEAKDLDDANDLVAEAPELCMDAKGESVSDVNDNNLKTASFPDNGDDALVNDAGLEGTAEDEGSVKNLTIGDAYKNRSSESVADRTDGDQAGLFEPGSVLVEFLREEASCMAAHSLHGRSFGQNVLTAGFFPHDLYLQRFPR